MSRFSMYFVLIAFLVAALSVIAAPSDVEARKKHHKGGSGSSGSSGSSSGGSDNSGSGSTSAPSGTYTGWATWYETGLGNCGGTNSDSDYVVALSIASDYDNGANCYRNIQIQWQGKQQQAQVVDSCQACNSGDIDMSPSLFSQYASTDQGVLEGVQWWYTS